MKLMVIQLKAQSLPLKEGPAPKNIQKSVRQHANKENNMHTLFDAIGSIIENPAFCEWMGKFCEDCPAVTRIPATRYTPAEELCPCDFQPFFNSGCKRQDDIHAIEAAADNLDELMKDAVA